MVDRLEFPRIIEPFFDRGKHTGNVSSEGQKRAKELYEPLHITSGGITVICNWLIKKDFTERTPGDSYDRRFVVLEISDIGRKVVQEVFDMRLEVLSTHFGSLMDEEIKEWNQKYKKLLKQVVSR
ncbi:MarR family winged helix-turn-helix transcriptional regulator [Paenibacillus xylanilyticus]|uniref:MarR family winged helix-turn-helix transcriptional regulator n=1 Tax=Paenibacillus xylanilyticus TaxID=248903 RepID=UPI00399FFF2E